MSKIKRTLAVGDRVRLRGYSYAGKVVDGCAGTITGLRRPDDGDVEVQTTNMGKVLVRPSQCRRLIRKPKERVWTESEIAEAWDKATPGMGLSKWAHGGTCAAFKKALGISND